MFHIEIAWGSTRKNSGVQCKLLLKGKKELLTLFLLMG